jgi:hypothetical protein
LHRVFQTIGRPIPSSAAGGEISELRAVTAPPVALRVLSFSWLCGIGKPTPFPQRIEYHRKHLARYGSLTSESRRFSKPARFKETAHLPRFHAVQVSHFASCKDSGHSGNSYDVGYAIQFPMPTAS